MVNGWDRDSRVVARYCIHEPLCWLLGGTYLTPSSGRCQCSFCLVVRVERC